MNKLIKLLCIILCICFIFSACSFNNGQDLVVSNEVKTLAQETIESIDNGESVETKKIYSEKIDEQELETDGTVDQENISYNGDITGKGLKLLGDCDGLTYYSQADSRWAKLPYTSCGDKSQTIKSSGCGVCCASMVISSSKGKIVPPTIAQLFVDNGHRTKSNGTAWSAWSFVADYFDFKEYYTTTNFDTVKKYLITDNNNDGLSDYFVVVSCGYGLFTTGGHYICIMGDMNDTFVVYDPYLYNGKFDTASRKNANVKISGTTAYVGENSFKKYANAKNYWVFSNDYVKVKPTTTTKKTTTTKQITTTKSVKSKTIMYVTVDNLNVRKNNSTKSDIVGSLHKGDKVSVDETKGNWAKIGSNKWVCKDYLTTKKPIENKKVTYKTKIGNKYRLKEKTILYSKSNLTGTKYEYYAKTEVKILKHISTTVDYVQVIKTGRKTYVKVSKLNI